jgi:hypothetical protein
MSIIHENPEAGQFPIPMYEKIPGEISSRLKAEVREQRKFRPTNYSR